MSGPKESDSPEGHFQASQIAFLRQMSHEMRSPLNSVIATTDMLLGGAYGEILPRQRIASERIMRNGERLLRLMDNAMTFIRASANGLPLKNTQLNPVDLLQHCLDQHLAAASKASLRTVIQHGPPSAVWGDPDYLGWIVTGLLSNALIASDQGEVRLSLQADSGNRWIIVLTDPGVGMTPEEVSQVGEPFFRGRAFRKLHPRGCGLTAAAIKQVLRMMDGIICWESTPGQGTRVTLNLPLVMPEYPG